MEGFLKKIKELRQKHNLSQSYVAEKLNIRQSNYGKLERGEAQFTLDKVFMIASVFNVPAYLLLYDEDKDEWPFFDKESELTIEAYKKENELLEMSNEQLLKIIELKNQSEKQLNTIINQLRTLLKQQIARNKKLKEYVSNSFEQLSKVGEDELQKLYPGLSNEQLEKHIDSLKQYFGLDIDDSIESDIWDELFSNVAELTEKMIENDKSQKPQTK